MAGAGYKSFASGDILTASDVNTYLMQQTVMVFADAAARTAAIAAPSEGMMSYLKDTNKTYRYDGSSWLDDAGTTSPLTTKGDLWTYSTTDIRLASSAVNGNVLTVDTSTATGLTWATPTTGGMTQLATGSLSGASVTVSSLSQSYTDLYIVVVNFKPATDAAYCRLRFNGSSSGYYNKLSAGVNNLGDFPDDSITYFAPPNDNSVANGLATAKIPFYTAATWKIAAIESLGVNATTTTYGEDSICWGYWRNTAAINSVTFVPQTGNFTSGTYYIYGVK